MLESENYAKKYLQFRKNLHRRFQVCHQKQGQLATRSPKCESSEKYDSIRLEGVQLQDERTLSEVRVLHRKDGTLGSDLEMPPEVIFYSLVRFGAREM
jgi:hypothetical protein